MTVYNSTGRFVDIAAVRKASVNRWHGIYSALGLELTFNKHTPCPACGGTKPFRFDDKEGRGTFICTHCGSGDGLQLIMNINGCDARQAAILVEDALGGNISQLEIAPAVIIDKSKEHQLARRKAEYMWNNYTTLVPDDHPYFIAKQIPPLEVLYFADMNMIGVPFILPYSGLSTIQFISLENKYYLKGSCLKGAYLPIGELTPDNKVIVATGYSTSVSVHLATGLMVLCCASDNGLNQVVADAVNSGLDVCIGCDNDHPTSKKNKSNNKNSGITAAITTAKQFNLHVIAPPAIEEVSDFNDLHVLSGLSGVSACFSAFTGESA